MGNKKRVKNTRIKTINLLASFLISLLLFIVATIIILTYTFFSSSYIIKVLDKQDFYQNTYDELCEQLELIAEPAGIDPEVLIQATNFDLLKADIDEFVTASYMKGDYTLETETIELEYFNAMRVYAENQGFSVEGELAENLHNIANACTNQYIGFVNLPLLDTIGALWASFKKYLAIILIISLVLVFTLICCLFFGNRWKHRAMRALVQSLIATGIMLTALPVVTLVLGRFRNINILSEGLYLFVSGYIESILKLFIYTGVFAIIIGVIFIFTVYRKMYQKAVM